MTRSGPTLFHITQRRLLSQILREGLRPNRAKHLTQAGSWANRVYGCAPVYLSLGEPWTDVAPDEVVLRVWLGRGHSVHPDLPSLIDFGAGVSEGGVFWERDEDAPAVLRPHLREGELTWNDLMEREAVARAAVIATSSLATCMPIPAAQMELA
jgi:hypothetical protein